MKKIVFIIIALIILFGGMYLFTNRSQKSVDDGKLNVTTSFYPLYFFASEIGGDKAEITNITPAGSEPHDYEPTAQDIAKIQNGKLLIVNGAGFEPWVDKLRSDLTQNKVTIVDATKGVVLRDAPQGEQKSENNSKDPHVWLNPAFTTTIVENIKNNMVTVDPQNKQYYEANAKSLKEKLGVLNNTYATGLADCERNTFVTSHAAFGYLATQYGLEQKPIAGLSPEEEPSAQQLAEIAAFAKENNVEYIFFETLVSPKLSETIATEIGAKTLVLDPIEGISENDSKQGKNYFTVMEENLKNLQTALACNK